MTLFTLVLFTLLSVFPTLAMAENAIPWDEVSLRAVQLQPGRYEGQTLTFHSIGLADIEMSRGSMRLSGYDMQTNPRRYHSAKTAPTMLLPAAALDAILPYVERHRIATIQGTIVSFDFYDMQWAFLIDTIRILDDKWQEMDLIVVPDSTLKARLMKRLKQRAYASSPAGIQAAKDKAAAEKKKQEELQRLRAEEYKAEQQRWADERRREEEMRAAQMLQRERAATVRRDKEERAAQKRRAHERWLRSKAIGF